MAVAAGLLIGKPPKMPHPRFHAAVARRLTALCRHCASVLMLSCSFACLLAALTTHAKAESTWIGSTGTWSTYSNWFPELPLSGASTSLVFEGSSSYTATNDVGNFGLSGLRFVNTAGTVTLNGAPTTNALELLNSPLSEPPSIALTGAGNGTISSPVLWNAGADVTNTGSGTLLFNGSQTFAYGMKHTFTNSGTGTITLGDNIGYANTGTSGGGVVLNLVNNNSAAGSFNVGNLGELANMTLNIGGTGTVKFTGSNGGDLFGNSTVLNVLSGATFDFGGNSETFGAFSGAGNVRSTQGLSPTAAGYFVFSGTMSGTGANLTVAGAGHTLVMSGSASDYTGATAVTSGRLVVGANAPNGAAGALGNATSDVLVGNTTGSANAWLLADTAGVTIGRNIRLQSGNTGTGTVGGLNTSGTVTYSGNVILGTNSGAAKGLVAYAASGGTVELTGGILRATSATGTTDTLSVNGAGTVVLKGTNTFTGATAVNGGTLLLDHTANNDSKLSITAALTLSGGSLSVLGNTAAATNVSVNGLSLGSATAPLGGGGRVTVTSAAGQTTTLNLGAITRNAGGSVDFVPVSVGGGTAVIKTSATNTAAGILGGYATFNKNDWAVVDGSGNVAGLTAGSYTTSFGAGLHTSRSSSQALASGGATTNTLRFTAAAAITFNSTTPGTLTLESGGILVASGTGATSIGGTGTRGTLSSSTGDVVVHQQSTSGTLTINSVINGSYLTKSGDGTLALSATNLFTGGTIINGGTLSIAAFGNLGATAAGVTLNGGTLAITTGTFTTSGTTFSASQHPITIGPAGGTFNFTANVSLQGGGLTGSGTLVKMGAGAVNVGSNSSSFSGDIIINGGSIVMNSSQFGSVASLTVNNGGTFEVNDDATAGFGIVSGGRFYLNGNGSNGNGAIRITDQSPNEYGTGNDPRTTMSNEIVLQTTARVQVDNAALVGSYSQLTFTNNVTGAGGLVKGGAGTLVLTGRDNSYAGSTSVENGTLRLDLGNDRLPTGTTVSLGTGATSGMLQLNGYSQTLAGLTTAGTGAANAVIGGSGTSTSMLTLNAAAGSQTYSGTLGGTGGNDTGINNNLGFTKSGPGSVTLEKANTYTGPTVVAQGTLVLGDANALGHGGASLATGDPGTTVQAGATLDLNGKTNVQEILTLNGTGAGGAGALVNNGSTPASIGSGIASLNVSPSATTGWSAASTLTVDAPPGGATATASAQFGISTGSLSLTNGGSGFTLSSAVVNVEGGSGAAVAVSLGVTSASYTITPGTTTYSTAPTVTLSNGATGVANLDANGLVTSITVTNPGSGFIGTPTLTFSGGTTTFSGTLPTGAGNNSNYTITALNVVNAGSGFTAVPTVTITGGTGATAVGVDGNFVLNGISVTNGGSGYASAPSVTINGAATATANVSEVKLASDSSIGGSGDLTIHAVVSGGHTLTKEGTGTATLTGANTYAGSTVVHAGTLQVGASGAGTTGSGNVIVDGSTAVLAGTGSILGSYTTVTLGTIEPGDNGGTGTGTLAMNSLMFTPASATTVAEMQIVNTTDFDKLMIAGDLTLNASSNLLVNGSGYSATVGDSFTLLDWSGLITTNGFSTGTNLRTGNNLDGNEGNLDLPDVSGIGLWQISDMINGGALTITVVGVPEPARGVLVMVGGVALVMRRRRRGIVVG